MGTDFRKDGVCGISIPVAIRFSVVVDEMCGEARGAVASLELRVLTSERLLALMPCGAVEP